jgi:hypothetical protein
MRIYRHGCPLYRVPKHARFIAQRACIRRDIYGASTLSYETREPEL